MSDRPLLQENAPPQTIVTPNVTDGPQLCELCRDPIVSGGVLMQRLELDPTGRYYRVHAICAHEYGLVIAAYLSGVK